MADKESKSFPTLGLMATAAAIGGAIVFTQVPLEVPRPGASPGLSYSDRSAQDVNARLWEDPFAAVSRDIRSAVKDGGGADTATLVELARQAQEKDAQETLGEQPQAATNDPCDAPRVMRPECVPHSLPWLMRDIRFALGQGEKPVLILPGKQPQGANAPKETAQPAGAAAPAPATDNKAEAKPRAEPDAPKPPRVLVLGVMVSNSPYVDGEERRRRVRFAVDSAMNLGQYSPVNAEHIGYVLNTEEPGLPKVIPFEWFRRKGRDPARRTLVMWLEEEALAGFPSRAPAPMANLARLAERIRSSTGASDEQIEFKIIGPATSGGLRALSSELKSYQDKAKSAAAPAKAPLVPLRGAHLYVAMATAGEEQMVCNKKERTEARSGGDPAACTFAGFLQRNGKALFGEARPMQFLRAIASDDAVSYTLIDELRRRGVDPSGNRDVVALVSEWDTYYGRMLPQAFLRALDDVFNWNETRFQSACEEDPEEAAKLDPKLATQRCPLLRFSYLRGLDGSAASNTGSSGSTNTSTSSSSAASAGKADAKASKDSTTSEASEGAKQFDYLRRLSGRMVEANQDLKRSGREITAIGIVGSDVYDKLAVLRALRKQFPRAVFFSTDLDARLLDASEQNWTRNLVLGSSYGLSLHPCIQKDIPPFRNGYQTAAFFATRVALFNAFPDVQIRVDRCREATLSEVEATDLTRTAEPLDQATVSNWLYPRIFEIGRKRAWDLTVEPISAPTFGASGSRCLGLHLCSNIHPPRLHLVKQSTRVAWITLGAFALTAAGLLLWRWRKNREEAQDDEAPKTAKARMREAKLAWLRWGLITWALVLTLVCLLLAIGDWRVAEGEPFSWMGGISVWPTEFLRLAAIVLAAFFIGDVMVKIRRNDEEMARLFSFKDVPDTRTWLQQLLGRYIVPKEGDVSVQLLWKQYQQSARPMLTFIRSALMTLMFGLIAWVLFQLFGWPNLPFRGETSYWIDWFLSIHVAVFAAYLLFSVNDATRLTTMFIWTLNKHQAQLVWPEAGVRRFSSRLGDHISDHLATWYMMIQLIAKRTLVISSLIFYPFVVGALVAVSRSAVFDNWDMPVGLLATIGLGLAIACASPLMMQFAANKVKTERVKALRAKLLQAKGSHQQSRITAIEALSESVQNVKEGAFQAFVEQPLVRAALLPFGGAGGLYLLDMFNFVRF